MAKDKNKDCDRSNIPNRKIINDSVGKKDNSNLTKFKDLGVKKDFK